MKFLFAIGLALGFLLVGGGCQSVGSSSLSSATQTVSTINIATPVDLKMTSSGNLFVLSQGNGGTVAEYDSAGNPLISKSGVGQQASGFDVDPSGSVYVVLAANNRVIKLKPDLANKTLIPDATFNGGIGYLGKADGSAGSGDAEFNVPYDVAVSVDGKTLFVSDTGNNRVQLFDASGKFQASLGSFGNGPEQFNAPKGIVAAPDNFHIYVVDSGNNRVVALAASGYGFETVGAAGQNFFGSQGSGPSQFQSPTNLSFDPNRVLVTDTGNNRIVALTFTESGETAPPFQPLWTTPSALGLKLPQAAILAATSTQVYFYVADTGNDRVLKILVNHSANF